MNKNCKAFSMIELLVATACLIILMIVVSYMVGTHGGTSIMVEEKIGMQKDARMAVQRLCKDLRSAHRLEYKDSHLTVKCFRGKPFVSFPGQGLEAAATETLDYFVENSKLYCLNKTTSNKEMLAENVKEFRIFEKDEYIGVKLEAEVEVYVERQKYDKLNLSLFTKVFPRYIYQAKKYEGFFSSVDDDKDY